MKTIQKFLLIHKKVKKPQQRELVDTPTIIPMHERRWIDIEPSEQTLAAYDLHTIKQYSGNKIEQFNSIEFILIFEYIPHKYSIGLMIVGNLVLQQEEVQQEDISIALIIREESFTSELFRETSGNNLIDPTLQDTVVIGSGVFHHIYHI